MARMFLYHDRPKQPSGNITATYPIYEFDYNQAVADGVSLSAVAGSIREPIIPDTTSYYARITAENIPTLNRYLSTNIPHQMWQDGSIFKTRMSPYILDEQGIYIPNPEYFNFRAIEVGVRPDDWGTRYYYQYKIPSAVSGLSYRLYYNVKRSATWDASAIYYALDDKDSNMANLFYTETGCRFYAYYGGDNSTTTGSPFRLSTNGDAMGSLSFYSPNNVGLSYRTSGGGYTACTGTSFSAASQTSANKALILQGNNPTYGTQVAFFIHFTCPTDDGEKEFYGVAATMSDSFLEDAQPTHLYVWAFTPEFWGDSIIAGDGGSSNWGPIPNPEYPDGSFTTNTTNVGDRDGQHILTEIERRRVQTSGIFLAGIYSIYEAAVYGDYTKLAKIEAELFNNEFISRYSQAYYEPLSGVLAMHILPSDFCVHGDWGDTEYDVVVAGYNVSDKWYQHAGSTGVKPVCKKLQHIHPYHVGSIDLGKMYDGFPDFSPFTKAILHLPFVGECELNMNAIAHGILAITYTCDVMNGNILVSVWSQDYNGNKQVIKVVNGNCAYSLPLYAKTMDGSGVGKMLSGVVSTIVSGAVGAATMNPLSLIGVASGVANTESAYASRSSIMVKGDLGGSAMLISPYDCWLEVIHPKWTTNMYYSKLMGTPSQMSNRIADNGQQVENGVPVDSGIPYTGYLQVQAIELDSVHCTESERSEIEKLLQSGVYVRGDELL